MTIKIATLGECLIEISELDTKTSENIKKFAYGGDVLNTSVYLSRNNIKTSFISAPITIKQGTKIKVTGAHKTTPHVREITAGFKKFA